MGDLANDKDSVANGVADRASQTSSPVEAILKQSLAVEDRALGGVAPILTHLLVNTGHSLVSDAIVAKLRGMLADLGRQLAAACLAGDQATIRDHSDRFADQLSAESALLSHCYALAMEGHLTSILAKRSNIDPVLTPLAQELIASEQSSTGELAMAFLAAQARFIQHQSRMQMPLSELPAELFHSVLRRWDSFCQRESMEAAETAIRGLKNEFDESTGRVGLLARLISSMRSGSIATLDLEHSGLALFASGLSALTKQPRELATLACHERQSARLVLSLRAVGLDEASIERQFLMLQPDERTPHGIGQLSPRTAQSLLTRTDADPVR